MQTFFKDIEYIIEKMSSLNEYYDKLGYNYGDKNNLTTLLWNSIENSKWKKYHGQLDVEYKAEQFEAKLNKMLFDEPNILKYVNPDTQEIENKDNDQFWKNLLIEKFIWLKELLGWNSLRARNEEEITPEMIANLSDNNSLEYNQFALVSWGIFIDQASTDILAYKKDQLFKQKVSKPKITNNDVYKNFTWFELFVKLDFEHFLKYFRHLQNLNFGTFI